MIWKVVEMKKSSRLSKTYHYLMLVKSDVCCQFFRSSNLSRGRCDRDLRSSLVIYDVFRRWFACSVVYLYRCQFLPTTFYSLVWFGLVWLLYAIRFVSFRGTCFDATGVNVNTATHLLCQTTNQQLFFNNTLTYLQQT